jgi:hypothetical protein
MRHLHARTHKASVRNARRHCHLHGIMLGFQRVKINPFKPHTIEQQYFGTVPGRQRSCGLEKFSVLFKLQDGSHKSNSRHAFSHRSER